MLKLINMTMVPKTLQAVLWSRNVSKLDIKRDKNYIIHQVLMYGSLEDIKWLKKTYKPGDIKKEFIQKPRKLYTIPAYNFIKQYLLGINKSLQEDRYVKTTPRNIG